MWKIDSHSDGIADRLRAHARAERIMAQVLVNLRHRKLSDLTTQQYEAVFEAIAAEGGA